MTVTLVRQEQYTKGWIGLSTDDKPTSQSGNVLIGANNGDTFYEVDTAKTFIFHDDSWYDMQDGSVDS